MALAVYGIILAVTYIVYQLFYNLVVSPNSKLPGPILCKLTSLYAKYYISVGQGHVFIHELHLKYGPVVQFTPYRVSIITKEGISKIYNSYKFTKSDFYQALEFGGTNIFSTPDRDIHKIRKKIMTPMFSTKMLPTVEKNMKKVGLNPFLEVLDRVAHQQKEIDIFEELHHLFFNTTGMFSFGINFNTIKERKQPIIKWLKEATEYAIISYQLPFLKIFGYWLGKTSYDELTAFCIKLIHERKEDHSSYKFNDIMDALINYKDPENGLNISDQDIAGEMVIQIIGGTDTSANTISFAIKLLLEHPKVLKKLVEEVDRFFPNLKTEITADEVRENCPYLEAVLYEVLRFFPATGGFLPRVAPSEGATISGHFIPGDMEVGTTVYAYHRHSLYWENPNAFNPDRFLGPEGSKLKSDIFTFSLGPRSCIGRDVAWVGLYITLANLIRRYNFTMENPLDPLKHNQFLVLKPEGGTINVKLTPRQ